MVSKKSYKKTFKSKTQKWNRCRLVLGIPVGLRVYPLYQTVLVVHFKARPWEPGCCMKVGLCCCPLRAAVGCGLLNSSVCTSITWAAESSFFFYLLDQPGSASSFFSICWTDEAGSICFGRVCGWTVETGWIHVLDFIVDVRLAHFACCNPDFLIARQVLHFAC